MKCWKCSEVGRILRAASLAEKGNVLGMWGLTTGPFFLFYIYCKLFGFHYMLSIEGGRRDVHGYEQNES